MKKTFKCIFICCIVLVLPQCLVGCYSANSGSKSEYKVVLNNPNFSSSAALSKRASVSSVSSVDVGSYEKNTQESSSYDLQQHNSVSTSSTNSNTSAASSYTASQIDDNSYKITYDVEYVDLSMFNAMPNLKWISVDSDNKNYCSVDGLLYSKDGTTLLRCPMGVIGKVNIYSGTKTIGTQSFAGCSKITEVKIPEGVSAINDYAFYGCTSLKSVTIPSSVENIGFGIFTKCTSLEDVVS